MTLTFSFDVQRTNHFRSCLLCIGGARRVWVQDFYVSVEGGIASFDYAFWISASSPNLSFVLFKESVSTATDSASVGRNVEIELVHEVIGFHHIITNYIINHQRRPMFLTRFYP